MRVTHIAAHTQERQQQAEVQKSDSLTSRGNKYINKPQNIFFVSSLNRNKGWETKAAIAVGVYCEMNSSVM